MSQRALGFKTEYSCVAWPGQKRQDFLRKWRWSLNEPAVSSELGRTQERFQPVMTMLKLPHEEQCPRHTRREAKERGMWGWGNQYASPSWPQEGASHLYCEQKKATLLVQGRERGTGVQWIPQESGWEDWRDWYWLNVYKEWGTQQILFL